MLAHQFDQVIRDYRRLRTLVPLGTLRTKKDYTRAPEIGSQGVVSEVLTGKRELNARQIKRLAKRFNVSPAVFV